MKLLFCTSNALASLVIRAFTWSQWSHVALVDGDEIIESVGGPGVRRYPLQQKLAEVTTCALVDFPCAEEARLISIAAAEIGKPYDYTGAIGIGLHRDWQATDSWFCSELIAWAFEQIGQPLFRAEAMHRVTPEHLWMLAPRPDPVLI